jgi:hypothetical protein
MKQRLEDLVRFVRQNRKTAIGIGVALGCIVLILLGWGVVSLLQPKANNTQPQSNQTPANGSPGKQANGRGPASAGPCSDGPLFNHIPMALSDFRAFRPLGFVTQPSHILGAKHSNFSINMPGESKKGLRVEFPSDAVVATIVSTESRQSSGYQMTFYPCDNFKSYFFHLGTIADKLAQEFKNGKATCQEIGTGADVIKKCQVDTELKVKSGELAGTSDGFGGVDFGAIDYRLSPAEYANLKRYDGDYPYYTSPVLYFTPELKAKLVSKLRSIDGTAQRTAEPVVGSLLQDIKGTAQGNWFIGDQSFMNSQDFSPFLALLHDYIDPSQPLFSMGTSVKGLKMGVYGFKPVASGGVNRDFKDIKPDGGTYCFDNFLSGKTAGGLNLASVDGVLIMTMPNDKKLKIEKVGAAGSTCATTPLVFTSAATVFER